MLIKRRVWSNPRAWTILDARGRSPNVRSSSQPIVRPRSRGSLPRLPYAALDWRPGRKCYFNASASARSVGAPRGRVPGRGLQFAADSKPQIVSNFSHRPHPHRGQASRVRRMIATCSRMCGALAMMPPRLPARPRSHSGLRPRLAREQSPAAVARQVLVVPALFCVANGCCRGRNGNLILRARQSRC
jgi:hypothetical protein